MFSPPHPLTMSSQINEFVLNLAHHSPPPLCTNPYSFADALNAGRRHNLSLYLHQMVGKQPAFLLIGEAPGYRGCRLTGVPFVSPQLLRQGVDDAGLFGKSRGYQVIPEWPHIQREASATMMWQTIAISTAVPLLWNAFPFHPYQAGNRQSNRPPTGQELAMGASFLSQLIDLFSKLKLVAVGNKAAQALQKWEVPFTKVRHPSHGGKSEFMAGMEQIFNTIS